MESWRAVIYETFPSSPNSKDTAGRVGGGREGRETREETMEDDRWKRRRGIARKRRGRRNRKGIQMEYTQQHFETSAFRNEALNSSRMRQCDTETPNTTPSVLDVSPLTHEQDCVEVISETRVLMSNKLLPLKRKPAGKRKRKRERERERERVKNRWGSACEEPVNVAAGNHTPPPISPLQSLSVWADW